MGIFIKKLEFSSKIGIFIKNRSFHQKFEFLSKIEKPVKFSLKI